MKKKLLLIATGGTIVSEQTEAGLAPLLSADGLLRFVPELTERYDIDILPVMNIESPDLLPPQWRDMAAPIQERYEDYDGFVIVHGTDTLSFTAAAMSYLIQNSRKTIVVTGSQYPIEDTVTDGKKNLRDSCVFAAESGMGGVYVVFAGQAILAGRAKKLYTKSDAAFASVNAPLAAAVQGDRIVSYLPPPAPQEPVSFYQELEERVLLVKLYPGMPLEAVARAGESCRGILLEGYGVAGLPAAIIPVIEAWKARGILVVVGTQALYEGTDLGLYTVGHALVEKRCCIQSFDMTSEAAIVKLMYALGRYQDAGQAEQEFLRPIGGDINVF